MRNSAFPRLAVTVVTLALCAACAPAARRPEASAPAAAAPRKVALVLGGGGARGFAHVGVIRVLEAERIPVDLIVGTSAGSLIGALYADRPVAFDLEATAWTIEQDDVFDFSIFGSGRGPIAGAALEEFVAAKLRSLVFERLRLPFVAVATDLRTGEEVVLRTGPVAPAVRASSAIPGFFRPVELGGRTLVDGGVVSPVPVAAARRLGADLVIAVDISRELPVEDAGNLASISHRSFQIMSRELARTQLQDADVVITPRVGGASPFDFARKRELMAAGLEAARAALPAIRAKLGGRIAAEPAQSQ